MARIVEASHFRAALQEGWDKFDSWAEKSLDVDASDEVAGLSLEAGHSGK